MTNNLAANEAAHHPDRSFGLKQFLSFRYMVTGNLMKVIYCLGLGGITFFSLFLLLSGFGTALQANNSFFGGAALAAGLWSMFMGGVILVVGNLLWRIACETWVVLFSMHEIMGSMERSLQRGAGAPAPQPVEARAEASARGYAATVQGGPTSGPFTAPPTDLPPAPLSPLSGRTCPRCGSQVRATASFCGSCGATVSG